MKGGEIDEAKESDAALGSGDRLAVGPHKKAERKAYGNMGRGRKDKSDSGPGERD
jgi:hypothetical protein